MFSLFVCKFILICFAVATYEFIHYFYPTRENPGCEVTCIHLGCLDFCSFMQEDFWPFG